MRILVVTVMVVFGAGCASVQTRSGDCSELRHVRIQQKGIGGELPGVADFLMRNYFDWKKAVPAERVDQAARKDFPEPFRGNCSVLANNQIEVPGASCAQVKALLVNAPVWPTWYANVADVKMTSGTTTLEPGTTFGFTTFGSEQSCSVKYVDERVGWTRPSTVAGKLEVQAGR